MIAEAYKVHISACTSQPGCPCVSKRNICMQCHVPAACSRWSDKRPHLIQAAQCCGEQHEVHKAWMVSERNEQQLHSSSIQFSIRLYSFLQPERLQKGSSHAGHAITACTIESASQCHPQGCAVFNASQRKICLRTLEVKIKWGRTVLWCAPCTMCLPQWMP